MDIFISLINDYWYFGLIIIFVFIIILVNSKKIEKRKPQLSNLGYSLFYADTRGKEKKDGVIYSILLHSPKYDICGKPDFIYKKIGSKMFLPVELKSGEIKDSELPHKGDLMQLVAYFLIIEDLYGVRPRKGHLIYKDYMFKVKNTRQLRNELKQITNNMRRMLIDGEGTANNSFITCKHCMCRDTVCEESSE